MDRKLVTSFLAMASVTTLTGILALIPEVINVTFIGRFGSVEELGAVGLGNSMQNCFALSVAYGLNAAFDTLTSTSGGAGDIRLSMLYLARGRIAVTLHFILVAPLLWYTNDILVALNQPARIAEYANEYNRMSLLGLWFVFQQNALRRFLQTRGEANVIAMIQVAVSLMHIVWCYVFVGLAEWGNRGVGLANSITWLSQYVLLNLYFSRCQVALGIEKQWLYFHWQWEVWSGMVDFLAVALPSAFLKCAAWIWWEVVTLFAGLCGSVQLAAHVAVYNVLCVCGCGAVGLSATTAFFVGNSIGKQDAHLARATAHLSLALSFAYAVLVCICASAGAPTMAHIYSHDPAVVDTLIPLFRIFAVCMLPFGMQEVLSTLMRICRRQNLAMAVVCVQHFVVSLSLTLVFGFVLHGGVFGMWWGSGCGTALGILVSLVVVLRTDMQVEVQKAAERISHDGSRAPLLTR